jgi:hypothetical protein
MNAVFAQSEKFNLERPEDRHRHMPLFWHSEELSLIRFSSWENKYSPDNSFYFRSPYIERFWLGILGPSATWLLRIVLAEIEQRDAPISFTSAILASRVGLADNTSWNSPLSRSIRRLIDFKIAKQSGAGHVSVSKYIPPLSLRQIGVLTADEKILHSRYLDRLNNGQNSNDSNLEICNHNFKDI